MRGVELLMVKFNERMVTDVVQTFWAAMQRGEFITDAAAEAGTYRKKGARWWNVPAFLDRRIRLPNG
jgi:hypothetical protein